MQLILGKYITKFDQESLTADSLADGQLQAVARLLTVFKKLFTFARKIIS